MNILRFSKRHGVATFVFAIVCCGTSAVAASKQTVFSYQSDPGEPIGEGKAQTFRPADSSIQLEGTLARLGVLGIAVYSSGESWLIDLRAPAGESFKPGRYVNVEPYGNTTGRAAGLSVDGNGNACSEIYGSYDINQVEYNAIGEVVALDMKFVQQCNSRKAPRLTGIVKYDARPLSYSYESDIGDPIGRGGHYKYLGAESIFKVEGTNKQLSFSVSGNRTVWSGSIVAPKGSTLSVGTYSTASAPTSSHAGFSISEHSSCPQSTGSLTISDLSFDSAGAVSALNATFEQHCDRQAPAYRGDLNYHGK